MTPKEIDGLHQRGRRQFPAPVARMKAVAKPKGMELTSGLRGREAEKKKMVRSRRQSLALLERRADVQGKPNALERRSLCFHRGIAQPVPERAGEGCWEKRLGAASVMLYGQCLWRPRARAVLTVHRICAFTAGIASAVTPPEAGARRLLDEPSRLRHQIARTVTERDEVTPHAGEETC